MIAKDMEGNVSGEKFGGVFAESKDGLDWNIHMGEKSYSRSVKWNDGTSTDFRLLERPFLLFQESRPTHLFLAACLGGETVDSFEPSWNIVLPIESGDNKDTH